MVDTVFARKLKKLSQNRVLKRIEKFSRQEGLKVYLVGGAVRDLFIEKKISKRVDLDFAVSENALLLGKKIARAIGGSFVVLDKINNTARVLYRRNNRVFELDFTDFRAKTLKEDLRRRDYSINTLCCELSSLAREKVNSDIIIDYFNARQDIKNKSLRLTRRDNIKDDPLRILRGFSLCSQFGFSFEKKTVLLIKKNVLALRKAAVERISEELEKIFSASFSHSQVLDMDKLGILEVILPEISGLRGLDQGLFHHKDVWGHSLETLKQLEKLLRNLPQNLPARYERGVKKYLSQSLSYKRPRLWILKLASLLHDIGKPETRSIGLDAKVHFYTHEKAGSLIAGKIGKRLKLSGREIALLKNIVLYHLRAGQLVNRSPGKRAKFRFFRDTRDDAALILLLTIADRRAMQGVLSKTKEFIFLEHELWAMFIDFFKKRRQKIRNKPLIDGHELMGSLSIPQGPFIGYLLRQIEEVQALKIATTKEQAIALAKKLYLSQSAEEKAVLKIK